MTEDAAPAAQAAHQPQLRLVSQYVRDLSFENPAAGRALGGRPDIQVTVNVNARRIEGQDNHYEVVVQLKATASHEAAPAFVAEVDYAGVFHLEGAPDNAVHPILLIECPRLLFPFARRVMSDVSRDGGYPPLMLDPIDFASLYRQQLQRQKEQQADQAPIGNA